MTGRDIAQMAVVVAAWVALIFATILMFGCLTISKDTERKLGGFVVDADCEADKVHVELQVDEQNTDRDAGVER